MSRPALSNLLNGNAALSGEMALRIEKAFGVRMETLMRMQGAHDIARDASSVVIGLGISSRTLKIGQDGGGLRIRDLRDLQLARVLAHPGDDTRPLRGQMLLR